MSNLVMYEQEFQGDVIYMMLYAVVAALNLVACCYLLFRRGNAFVPDITSPVCLRRWTAAFFAAMTLSHLWYMPSIYLTSSEDKLLCYSIGALLDYMTTFPLAIVILFTMLQDRRRPLWLAWVMIIPLVIIMALYIANHSEALLPILNAYLLLLAIGLIIYMVREVRRYGRWLRDNYADLEHKEIWQSFVVLAVILLGFGIYTSEIGGLTNKYIVQLNNIILICYLLWRVETLSDLSISQLQDLPIETEADSLTIQTDIAEDEDNTLSLSERHRSASPLGLSKNIEPLLKQYCEESHLYLQHDINISRLARVIGINRLYLSQYFSSQGMNYNAYINDLRINHFISLYHEAVATHRPVIAQQLAFESGYQSYNTFRDAFKRKTGQSVTAWMARQRIEV
jgi:AraC-like DNA-binding protein